MDTYLDPCTFCGEMVTHKDSCPIEKGRKILDAELPPESPLRGREPLAAVVDEIPVSAELKANAELDTLCYEIVDAVMEKITVFAPPASSQAARISVKSILQNYTITPKPERDDRTVEMF